MHQLIFVRFALCILVACGAQQPRSTEPAEKPEPPSTGMKELAAEVDANHAEITRIIHEHRDDCPRMAAEMRALFERVAVTFDRVRTALKDPALSKELVAHLRTYDESSKQREAAIGADLDENKECALDPGVIEAMESMPTL